MKHLGLIFMLVYILISCQIKPRQNNTNFVTFCNPLNLSYRFSLDLPSRREAADPTVVWFKDRYFLFASKSGGYWYSRDLTDWMLIETSEIPTEEYAPTAVAIQDTLYFLASSTEKSTIYKSSDPLSGHWSIARERLEIPVWDPDLFLDDDGRLYLYWGCSNVNPLYGVELDYSNNFSFVGKPRELIRPDPGNYGWLVPGDNNELIDREPWIEGSWMNKHNGTYYLQFSGPGTEFKSYADGVCTSDNPLGPFVLQKHNPFACKPEGFADGAGHGSTFTDHAGNYWHIGTITISQKHMFERRLGMYPAFFDDQGTLYAVTKYGDYPLIIPEKKISDFDELFPGWMLLSYHRKVEVSSSVDSFPSSNITDENIRTYWAAESGSPGEYAILDLVNPTDVYAIQINFAEHNTKIRGRQNNLRHRYTVEYSKDASDWTMLIDQSGNNTDNSHVYFQLPDKISCEFLKINNIEVPGGNFALSGFRVFGKGHGNAPGQVNRIEAERNSDDRRSVNLTWEKSENATGYNISFGMDKNRMYNNHMVYRDTTLALNNLDTAKAYYFSIESFNENGITTSGVVTSVE